MIASLSKSLAQPSIDDPRQKTLLWGGQLLFFDRPKLARGDGPFRKSWGLTGLEGALEEEEEQACRGWWQVG